jgi:hypothetical protein
MSRFFVTRTPQGQLRILLGPERDRAERKIGKTIDRAITRAFVGDVGPGDFERLAEMAQLAESLGRKG